MLDGHELERNQLEKDLEESRRGKRRLGQQETH